LWDKIEVTAESFAELENIIRKLYTQPELDDVLSVVTRIRHIWVAWNLDHSNEVSSELDKTT
jgi:hypothetical protein